MFHEYADPKFGRTDTQSWSPEGLPYFDPGPTGCKGQCMCAVKQSDDTIIANAQAWLRNFSVNSARPFFLAVGLHRPHLPWSVPQEFFNHYNQSNITTAKHPSAPKGMPPIAWHSCSKEEDGCFNDCIPSATDAPDHPATLDQQRRTRHGYYVSYPRAQPARQQLCGP